MKRTMTAPKKKPKLLYVASTASHLKRFHVPYLEALSKEADVYRMASGDETLDFCIPFEKNMLSLANVRTIFKIRRILKKNQFDAVILNTSLAAFLVRAAMIGMRRRPYVHNIVHGYLFDEPIRSKKDRILRLCEKIVRRKTDAISVMNEADLAITQRNRLSRGENASFMYGMGVDLDVGTLTRNTELRVQYASEEDLLCMFVGELSARKNQTFLIEGTKLLRERGIPMKLMLLGEGAEREALEAQIASSDLLNHVFLLGNREPVLPYLAAADLYVSASKIEGLPFNVMEAMACGLPIIASSAKGQTDLLSNTPNAIYQTNDMEAFCNAVEAFYKNGRRGVGTVEYPVLERYRLSSVFNENMKLMRKGWC